MYEQSCEIIYDMISKRIKKRRKDLKLTNAEIFPNNENLMSAIANNRKHKIKNPYLIPKDMGKGELINDYLDTISKNLKFKSPTELIWGNSEEINSYINSFLVKIIEESIELLYSDELSDNDKEQFNYLHECMTDYIPLLKSEFYLVIEDINPELFNGIFPKDFKSDFGNYQYDFTYAALRLIKLDGFNKQGLLDELIKSDEGTYKLNSRILKLVKNSLIPKIKENYNVLGSTIRTILSQDLKDTMTYRQKRALEYANEMLSRSIEAYDYYEDESYLYPTVIADLNYLKALEKIQQENEKLFFKVTLSCNNWSTDLMTPI